ncbi:DUF465 domain-containing protein [Altererythrobacter xixiisoli]|uniref:DUF465 domain-containing protein n=1 Tax=Croceibacterium xixiisoli TaxID=1476466 RepID=A0A6I4TZC0_9SPHN|nr:DUF465 domain-containing protein [Croceibacterium xixiisoli]MXP00480.1 DUF465 domain-containing protein [Croceibacterium xixiisoli]
MSDNYIERLRREHARLEGELEEELSRTCPDQMQVKRLKKMKLAVKDLMAMVQEGTQQMSKAA